MDQPIPIEQISPSPFQARKDFDPVSIRALADSIEEMGLLEPIIVRKTGGRYELIAGERRWRAYKLLKRGTIEARVIETKNDADAAAKGLLENLQRENLNPIEEAHGFQTLDQLDPKKWTQQKIAKIAGKDQTYISRSLTLLHLHEEVQEIMRRRIISREHGIELARLPNKKDQLKAARQIPGKLTREETRALVDRMLGKTKDVTPAQAGAQKQDPLQAVWDKLRLQTGAPQGTWKAAYKGGGEWVITWRSPGITPIADLTRWLTAALAASGVSGGDVSTNPAIKIRNNAPGSRVGPVPTGERSASWGQAPAVEVEIAPEFAPSSDAELAQAERETEAMRLPRDAAEQAELEALAAQSPSAAYAWVFGKKSFYLKSVAGKTWKDLGYTDPIKAVNEMVEGLKKLKFLK